MPAGNFYEWQKCKWGIGMWSYGDGWIDEYGKFGYFIHPGGELDGQPEGDYTRIRYHEKICLNCKKKFKIVLNNDAGYKIKFKQFYKDDQIYVIDNKDNTDICPFCSKQLYSFEQMLELVKSKDSAAICPNCKNDFLKLKMHGVS